MAGIRPEPAVSVPRANDTNPAPTKGPEPADEPPGMNLGSNGFSAIPYGVRVPTRPVAN